MLRKSAAVLAVVLCLANVNATRAEPGPVVRWMMDEPVSLFEIGLLRLDMMLISLRDAWAEDEEFAGVHNLGLWSDYDWDKNRIHLIGWSTGETLSYEERLDQAQDPAVPDEKEARRLCKLIIDKFRDLGGVFDGEARLDPPSIYSSHFQHKGYRSKNEPDDYRQKLDQIMEIQVILPGAKCHGPLVSHKIYFEE